MAINFAPIRYASRSWEDIVADARLAGRRATPSSHDTRRSRILLRFREFSREEILTSADVFYFLAELPSWWLISPSEQERIHAERVLGRLGTALLAREQDQERLEQKRRLQERAELEAQEREQVDTNKILHIEAQAELAELAKELQVRPDWHEPDEYEVGARIIGSHLDNAFGSTTRPLPLDDSDNLLGEYNVIITKGGEDIAVINLATLLAIAAGTYRQMKD